MHGIRSPIRGLTVITQRIASVGIILIAVITCLDVVLRYFRNPIFGSYDIIRVVEGITIAFSLLYTQSQKGHLSLELFVSRVSPQKRTVIELFNSAVSFLFSLLLTYIVLVDAYGMFKNNLLSMSLGFPLYPFAYAIAVGCLMMCPPFLMDFITTLREAPKK